MGKNEVTLTFVGDADKLTKTFAKLENDSKQTGDAFDKLDKRSRGSFDGMDKNARKAGEGFDRLGDGADTTEQRIIGFRDALTGSKDVAQGFATGDLELIATGFADLASSVANLAAPALKKFAEVTRLNTVATKAQTVAQRALNLVMRQNPFVLIATLLIALGVALTVAYKKSETFRDITKGAFDLVKGAANGLKAAGAAVLAQLLALYNSPVGKAIRTLFVGAFDAITTAARAVGGAVGAVVSAVTAAWKSPAAAKVRDVIGGAFRAMLTPINSVLSAVNSVVSKIEWAIGRVQALTRAIQGRVVTEQQLNDTVRGGRIPGRAAGGIVTGRQLSWLGEQGPEVVLPLNRPQRARQLMAQAGLSAGSGVTITIQNMVVRDESDIARIAAGLSSRLRLQGIG